MIFGGEELLDKIKSKKWAVLLIVVLLVLVYLDTIQKTIWQGWMAAIAKKTGGAGTGSTPSKSSFGMMDQTAALGAVVSDQVGLTGQGTALRKCMADSSWTLGLPSQSGGGYDSLIDEPAGLSMHKSKLKAYKSKSKMSGSSYTDRELNSMLHA